MPSGSAAVATRPLARTEKLELSIPECAKGIGSVIGSPESADLISDVRIQPFSLYADDRGYFLEVHRMGRGLAGEFPAATTQFSAALSYPGGVKAFHYHLHQTDC